MRMGLPDESRQSPALPEPAVRLGGWATRPYVPLAPSTPSFPNEAEPLTEPVDHDPPTYSSSLRSLSQTGWLLLGTAAVVMAVMTFVVPAWAAAQTSPRVILLGSGDSAGSSLSVLIVAGDARVVIAAGDDPAAFGRAIRRALALSPGRIDLLIVAATETLLAVPADLAGDDRVGDVVRLGAPHPGRQTGDLPSGLPQVPPHARIEIAPGVVALIETVEVLNPDGSDDFDLAWRAEIRHGAATVTVLSDAEHAGEFPPLTSEGVLVVARDPGTSDLGSLLPSTARALVVNAKDTEGSEIREDLPPMLSADLLTIRVHSGTAVTLLLNEDGVELPRDDVVIVHPGAPLEGAP